MNAFALVCSSPWSSWPELLLLQKSRKLMHFCGCSSIILSETSFRPLYTKSNSWRHGKSCLKFSGGCRVKSFYISISTSKARTRSGFSECSAFVILEMHRIMTRIYCLSWIVRLTVKSSGIASAFNNWSKQINEAVNSFELSSLLTSLWDSWVSSFCCSRSCVGWSDSRSINSFSKLNALKRKLRSDLYVSVVIANKTSSWSRDYLSA